MGTRLFLHVYICLCSGVMKRDWRIVVIPNGDSTTVTAVMMILQSHAVSQPLLRPVWVYFQRSNLLIKFFLDLVTEIRSYFSIWENILYIYIYIY